MPAIKCTATPPLSTPSLPPLFCCLSQYKTHWDQKMKYWQFIMRLYYAFKVA